MLRTSSSLRELPHTSSRENGRSIQPKASERPEADQYKHILVPVSDGELELPAMRLAMELAAAHGSRLTLLSIHPPQDQPTSLHFLDGIDRLHHAMTSGGRTPRLDVEAAKRLIESIRSKIEARISEPNGSQANATVEIRWGDFADNVVGFAEANSADLIILTLDKSRYWSPFLPQPIRRIQRLPGKQVILM